jgi:hypothetical protein
MDRSPLGLAVSHLSYRKEKWPRLTGPFVLTASRRLVVVMMVVMVVARLCTRNCANRERNSGDGGQNESKLPHKNFSLSPDF